MEPFRHSCVNSSIQRLEHLIALRLEPGADKPAIDRRIWDLFGETWTVMFTDLSGFSRHVAEFGIIHFLQTIHESKRLLFPVIEAHDGIVLKVEGDSFLVLFRNPLKALHSTRAMLHALEEYNTTRPREEAVLLCIGLGHGPVLRIGDQDVFGAEVNAAAKLGEDTAKAGEVLATEAFVQAAQIAPEHLQPLDYVPPGARKAWKILSTP